jgi:hypothetical protein
MPVSLHLVQLYIEGACCIGESVGLWYCLQLGVLISTAITPERILPNSVPWRLVLYATEFVDHIAEWFGTLSVSVETLLKLRVC